MLTDDSTPANAAAKQASAASESPTLVPPKQNRGQFVKGDERINRAGKIPGTRNKLTPLKEIGEKIAAQTFKLTTRAQKRKAKELGLDVYADYTMAELMMLDLATSSNAQKMQMFFDRTFGPVVTRNVNTSFDFARYASKFTDAELQAILDGADPLEILISKIPDVSEGDTTDDNAE